MENRRMLFLINPHAGKAEIKGRALDLVDLFVRGGWRSPTCFPAARTGTGSSSAPAATAP